MRLLHTRDFSFKVFQRDPEPYAVLSHRWTGQETTFADIHSGRVGHSSSSKVSKFAHYVQSQFPNLQWIWVDSCCINQDSAAELSEAVNCMFEWYRNAKVCIAYLEDVGYPSDLVPLEGSEWFKRGWTLQELLASQVVIFLTQQWSIIGHKGDAALLRCGTVVGPNIETRLARRTGVPLTVLRDFSVSHTLSVKERMSWMTGRHTLKEEDKFYSLFGIFGVAPGAIYGEKEHRAKRRLVEAIEREHGTPGCTQRAVKEEEDIVATYAWLSSVDPSTNHSSAREHHEPGTCTWLLQRQRYRQWRTGEIQHLWLHGKPGCGKSVLCSVVIEDLQVFCRNRPNAVLAYFYFTFSDDRKQSYSALLASLLSQLARQEPTRALLNHLRGKCVRREPGMHELEDILVTTLASFAEAFVILDALDESPELRGVRQDLLRRLEKLALQVPQLKLLVTSRHLSDIREWSEKVQCGQIWVQSSDVSDDIQSYVTSQLSIRPRMRTFSAILKSTINEHVAQNADGTFRWAYLLIEEMAKLKRSSPGAIEAALKRFPKHLDDIYARILQGIEDYDQQHVHKLLYWIAYAREPLTLQELVDALIIEPDHGSVAIGERCVPEDVLRLLSSLVVVINNGAVERHSSTMPINGNTKIRFAHFTVLEFLESRRILQSQTKDYHLDSRQGHSLLARSSITYIMHYDDSDQISTAKLEAESFPLLLYAARLWSSHSTLHQSPDVTTELQFLQNKRAVSIWLRLYRRMAVMYSHAGQASALLVATDKYMVEPSAIYLASCVGLTTVVKVLLENRAEATISNEQLADALRGAAQSGHIEPVKLLLEYGADVNALGQDYGSALLAASREGQLEIVRLLLNHGAKLNLDYNNMTALHQTALTGYQSIARAILESGVSVDLPLNRHIWLSSVHQGKRHWQAQIKGRAGASTHALGQGLTPLHFAALIGSVKMTQFFLEHGADVNASSEFGETPLHLQLKEGLYGQDWQAGHEDYWNDPQRRSDYILDIADPEDGEDEYYAMQAKIQHERLEILDLLLSHVDTRISARDYRGRSPLHCVRYGSGASEFTLTRLLVKGSNPNLQDEEGRLPLHLACLKHDTNAVAVLFDHGADIRAVDNNGMNAMHYAALSKNEAVMRQIFELASRASILMDPSKQDNLGRTALHHFLDEQGYVELDALRYLLSVGGGINILDNDGKPPLAILLSKDFLDRSSHKAMIAHYLFQSGADPSFVDAKTGLNLGHMATSADEVGLELLKTLATNGVDLKARDADRRTILHHLALHGSLVEHDALHFLLNTTDLSCIGLDKFGKTPLDIVHEAQQKDYPVGLFRSNRWCHMESLLAAAMKPHSSIIK